MPRVSECRRECYVCCLRQREPASQKFCDECGAALAGTKQPTVSSGFPAHAMVDIPCTLRDYTPKHLTDKILQSKCELRPGQIRSRRASSSGIAGVERGGPGPGCAAHRRGAVTVKLSGGALRLSSSAWPHSRVPASRHQTDATSDIRRRLRAAGY